jgi:hypothetical protein
MMPGSFDVGFDGVEGQSWSISIMVHRSYFSDVNNAPWMYVVNVVFMGFYGVSCTVYGMA